jgi:hypothetical protein
VTSDTLEPARPEMSRLPSPGVAPAGQQARLSEVRKRLLEDVIEFLSKMKNGGESELGHNPRSEDLIPCFQRYALSVIEARSKEEIVNAASISEARALIRNAVDMVVRAICRRGKIVDGTRKPPGVWLQTIQHACKAVNLGSWTTEYGTYDQTAFFHPPHKQLRAFLLVQAHELETQFWNHRAKNDQSAPLADHIAPAADSTNGESRGQTSDAKGPFPGRAKWLDERLYERAWSPHEFYSHGGPDRGTTRRILDGLPVRLMTLDKVAEGLSKKHSKVSPSDIPNC